MRRDLIKCRASIRGGSRPAPQVLYAIRVEGGYRVVLRWHETEEPEQWLDLPETEFEIHNGDRGARELVLKRAVDGSQTPAMAG